MIVPSAEREGLVKFCPEEGLWSLDIELMCKASLADTKPMRMFREALIGEQVSSGPVRVFSA
jgi:hypothetical protein